MTEAERKMNTKGLQVLLHRVDLAIVLHDRRACSRALHPRNLQHLLHRIKAHLQRRAADVHAERFAERTGQVPAECREDRGRVPSRLRHSDRVRLCLQPDHQPYSEFLAEPVHSAAEAGCHGSSCRTSDAAGWGRIKKTHNERYTRNCTVITMPAVTLIFSVTR